MIEQLQKGINTVESNLKHSINDNLRVRHDISECFSKWIILYLELGDSTVLVGRYCYKCRLRKLKVQSSSYCLDVRLFYSYYNFVLVHGMKKYLK